MWEIIECIIICLFIIGDTILMIEHIVSYVISDSWEFRKKEYDSVEEKTDDFYIEYEKKKEKFIKNQKKSFVLLWSFVRVTIFLLAFPKLK